MITQEEYEIIKHHYDLLYRWSIGHSTTVTRSVWQDLAPIASKYSNKSFNLNCSYCTLQLCKCVWDLFNQYEENQI